MPPPIINCPLMVYHKTLNVNIWITRLALGRYLTIKATFVKMKKDLFFPVERPEDFITSTFMALSLHRIMARLAQLELLEWT